MADNDYKVQPSEFAQLPLDGIIQQPLIAAIEAHKKASLTTLEFIKELTTGDDGNVQEFTFQESIEAADGTVTTRTRTISAPLLALVNIPNLSVDTVSIEFDYEISQVAKKENKTSFGVELKSGPFLSKFVTLTGKVSGSYNRELTSNRGGSLQVRVHASEKPLPEGLQRILKAITDGMSVSS